MKPESVVVEITNHYTKRKFKRRVRG